MTTLPHTAAFKLSIPGSIGTCTVLMSPFENASRTESLNPVPYLLSQQQLKIVSNINVIIFKQIDLEK